MQAVVRWSTSIGGHGCRRTGLSRRRGYGLKRRMTRDIEMVEDKTGPKNAVLCDLRLNDEEGRGE